MRLRERGVIRRLRRHKGHHLAQYVRVGVQADEQPFDNRTMTEVIEEVLGSRNLNQTEIAVAMLEAGYQTTMSPKRLRDAVGVKLRADARKFVRRENHKWSA